MKTQLNPNAKKLVRALRSGKYRQCRGTLHRIKDNRFCCLGVACDMFINSGGKLKTTEYWGGHMLYDGEGEFLPDKVRKFYGFTTNAGNFKNSSLMVKNDEGASFKQIAAIIERKPNGLFVDGK